MHIQAEIMLDKYFIVDSRLFIYFGFLHRIAFVDVSLVLLVFLQTNNELQTRQI